MPMGCGFDAVQEPPVGGWGGAVAVAKMLPGMENEWHTPSTGMSVAVPAHIDPLIWVYTPAAPPVQSKFAGTVHVHPGEQPRESDVVA